MTTFISAEGSIAIPAELLKNARLQPGQRCDIEQISDDELRVRLRADDAKPKEGLGDLLARCPVKGFFVPLERGETTDDLKPLNFE